MQIYKVRKKNVTMKGAKVLTLSAVGVSFTVSQATHIDYTCISLWVYIKYTDKRIHACGTYIRSYLPLVHALARAHFFPHTNILPFFGIIFHVLDMVKSPVVLQSYLQPLDH